MPSLGSGGAERVLVNILQRIDLDKYDIDLCVVMKYGRYFKELPEGIGVTVLLHRVLIARILTYLYTRFSIRFFYRYLVRLKLRKRYDVAISFVDSSYTELIFMLPYPVKMKIAWSHASVASYSNFSKFYSKRYVEKLIYQRYRRMDTLVFVSNDSMEEFIRIFGRYKDMRVIYNVLDINGIIQKSEQKQLEHNGITQIAAFGSLYPVKGYDKLIAASEMMHKEGLKFKVRIFGEGYLKGKLQGMIDEAGLNDIVILEGFCPNPYPYMRAADIFTMTSVSEALPTSLCEAMVLGKPVVVTDCSGCKELVNHGQYGIMTKQTVQSIYEGLKEMVTDTDLRQKYSALSRKRSAIFDDTRAMERLYQLFEDTGSMDHRVTSLQ